MALDDRTVAIFKRLVVGIGQPDEREFAKAILTLDAALAELAGRVASRDGTKDVEEKALPSPRRTRASVEAP